MPSLAKVFRRSSLSNEGDRAALLDHPGALVLPVPSLTSSRVRVAIVEPNLTAGFATTIIAEKGHLELVDLFIDPDWMRRGAATALINDTAAYAATIGVDRVSVVGNPHALAFYERAGFLIAGEAATEFGAGLRMHLAIVR
jgi:GNAT superfamily N-acetyltransferase